SDVDKGNADQGIIQRFPKLQVENGIYQCTIYDNRPKLCSDFNCIAWAKCTDTYDRSELVACAKRTYEGLNNEGLCN
ncbi:MAG: hypothetical protein NC123_20775, partial [Butyrivibrio sp.]|nr:hypothetical protein [Butyrivibrio sp.]